MSNFRGTDPSLYIPAALEQRFGVQFHDQLVPEFPVRIGTIYPEIPINKSYKVDYVGLSTNGDLAVLVELKTDGASRRSSQDAYLVAARDAGMKALLEGIREIFCATNAKRKYFHLLAVLQSLGLLEVPRELSDIMAKNTRAGATNAAQSITPAPRMPRCEVLYLQPAGTADDTMNFEEFRSIVARQGDALSQRFAQSLGAWMASNAGEAPV